MHGDMISGIWLHEMVITVKVGEHVLARCWKHLVTAFNLCID